MSKMSAQNRSEGNRDKEKSVQELTADCNADEDRLKQAGHIFADIDPSVAQQDTVQNILHANNVARANIQNNEIQLRDLERQVINNRAKENNNFAQVISTCQLMIKAISLGCCCFLLVIVIVCATVVTLVFVANFQALILVTIVIA